MNKTRRLEGRLGRVRRYVIGCLSGAILIVLGGLGCSSNMTSEPTGTPLPNDRVARILGTTFADSTTQTARMLTQGNASAPLPDYIEKFANTLGEDCPLIEGNTNDQDGDGIAASQQTRYRADACRFALGEMVLTLSGSVLSEDFDDTDPTSGFRLQTVADAPLVVTQNGTEVFRALYNVESTPSEIGFAVSQEASLRYATIGTFDYSVDLAITPDVPGELVSGQVVYTGDLAWAYDESLFALTIVSDDLQLDAGCYYGFASGSVTLSDNATPANTVTVTYLCNDFNVDTEGL